MSLYAPWITQSVVFLAISLAWVFLVLFGLLCYTFTDDDGEQEE